MKKAHIFEFLGTFATSLFSQFLYNLPQISMENDAESAYCENIAILQQSAERSSRGRAISLPATSMK